MVDASRADARHSNIYISTFSIFFLATPHRGSAKADIGKILVNMIKVSLKQVNKNLLAELEKDNTSLQDLTEDFSHLHSHFQIANFTELKATNIRWYLPKIIVRPELSVQSSVNVT